MIISQIFWLFWVLFGVLSSGPAAFIFLFMRRESRKPWTIKIDHNFRPKISIVVPTYNESEIIDLKLSNLGRLKYPADLVEIIVVDSNSDDGTVEAVKRFIESNPGRDFKLLEETERKGKSQALNHALDHCKGDLIIVSDADCFWPSDILERAAPFLADPTVGAVSGPKILLNSKETWVTRMEEDYLKSANLLRLGESKAGSTVFFEGGFSAFKKEAVDKFDPYKTGSDDCGTVIRVIERNFRAVLVPEALFYSSFPASFRGKIAIKLRRANQLVRMFARYVSSLLGGRIKTSKITILPNIFLYLFSPIAFVIFLGLSGLLFFSFPYLLLIFVLLMIPRVRFYFYEILENNSVLLLTIFGVVLGRKFSIWSKPEDRLWLTKEILTRSNLV